MQLANQVKLVDSLQPPPEYFRCADILSQVIRHSQSGI